MLRGFKVKLHPTVEQRTLMLKSFGTARWVYNWALNRQKENYAGGGKFIGAFELKKEITRLKNRLNINGWEKFPPRWQRRLSLIYVTRT